MGHIAFIVARRDAYRFSLRNMREREYLEDTDVDGRIILKWIFKQWEASWSGFV